MPAQYINHNIGLPNEAIYKEMLSQPEQQSVHHGNSFPWSSQMLQQHEVNNWARTLKGAWSSTSQCAQTRTQQQVYQEIQQQQQEQLLQHQQQQQQQQQQLQLQQQQQQQANSSTETSPTQIPNNGK